MGADGSLYFVMDVPANPSADQDSFPRVCRVTPDGLIYGLTSKEPATGTPPLGQGDGGLARYATIADAQAIAIGPDGSIFVTDNAGSSVNCRVRRIGPDGIISTYAGGPGAPTDDTPGRATAVRFGSANGLAVDADGTLYLADAANAYYRVKAVSRNGWMTTILTGNSDSFVPMDLDIGPDGALYISSQTAAGNPQGRRVYRFDRDGAVSVVAGGPDIHETTIPSGSSFVGFAAATRLGALAGLGVAPNGDVYAVQGGIVIKISKPFPKNPTSNFTIPSENGGELYTFDSLGRHLWTRDALTGALRFQFNYDTFGRLTSIYG
ncbi:MAG: hypothetical protein ACREMY_22190, partial [bacterium]